MKNGKKFVKKAPKVTVATKRYVKRVLDNAREDKYIDQSLTAGTAPVASTTGSITLLSPCSQGTTYATRIGETIMAKSLEVRIDATSAKDTSTSNAYWTNLRCIIFQDRQIRTSTLPTIADLLETTVYNSPLNHIGLNASRFRILLDRMIDLDPNNQPAAITAFATNKTCQSFKKVVKLGDKICYTNATTGTQKNNVYIMFLSDQATTPVVNVYSRIKFEDA